MNEKFTIETKSFLLGQKFSFWITLIAILLLNPPLLKRVFVFHRDLGGIVDLKIICGQIFFLVIFILLHFLLPKKLKYLYLSIMSLGLFFFLVELILTAFPLLLGQDFANMVWSQYHDYDDGIYYFDPELKINFMKKNYETTCYFNGYQWKHQTDNRGFRNQENHQQADIALMGDSFVYGHGLEEEETIGHFLEKKSNLSTVNLGFQGSSVFEGCYVLNRFTFLYKPKIICYFFCSNDLRDLERALSPKEMTAFCETPLSKLSFTPSQLVPPKFLSYKMWSFFSQRPYFVKALRLTYRKWQLKDSPIAIKKENSSSLVWLYTFHALKQMKLISEQHHTRFILIPLPLENPHQFEILRRFAEKEEIELIDTREMEGKPHYFLAKDGHFNSLGTEKISEIIWQKLSVD